jgi:hypothetical protein
MARGMCSVAARDVQVVQTLLTRHHRRILRSRWSVSEAPPSAEARKAESS